jgi:hypothetical protein
MKNNASSAIAVVALLFIGGCVNATPPQSVCENSTKLACGSDAECGHDQICEGGSCVPDGRPKPDAKRGCGSDAECGLDQICEGGSCVPDGRPRAALDEAEFHEIETQLDRLLAASNPNKGICIRIKKCRIIQNGLQCEFRCK